MQEGLKIQLTQSWIVGLPIGDTSGFGHVFDGVGEGAQKIAMKFVPKEPGASRELLFGDLPDSEYIVPFLDTGEWEDFYVMVMPLAETSLAAELRSGKLVDHSDAIDVLIDVSRALCDIHDSVVHRDIKPANILRVSGKWCIADFGIARYAEATTGNETRKFMMTPPYASPEQWRHEHATSAADVYAFGVMAYELLEGDLPFPGPNVEDFRQQHTQEDPPQLKRTSSALTSLVKECLFKSPEARPSPQNILNRLEESKKNTPRIGALEQANLRVVTAQSSTQAKMAAEEERLSKRKEICQDAFQSLCTIQSQMLDVAKAGASALNVACELPLKISLGDGELFFNDVELSENGPPEIAGRKAPFDVIASSVIVVGQMMSPAHYQGRSHSLWFADAQEESVYRWYEIAFFDWHNVDRPSRPFALSPNDHLAAEAVSNVMTQIQIAWQPTSIDQGDEGQFIERWLTWFASASDKALQAPHTLPEQSGGGFRT